MATLVTVGVMTLAVVLSAVILLLWPWRRCLTAVALSNALVWLGAFAWSWVDCEGADGHWQIWTGEHIC